MPPEHERRPALPSGGTLDKFLSKVCRSGIPFRHRQQFRDEIAANMSEGSAAYDPAARRPPCLDCGRPAEAMTEPHGVLLSRCESDLPGLLRRLRKGIPRY